MSYTTTENISLDLYNSTIQTVEAKQFNGSSRFVEVEVTENGLPIVLNKNEVKAYITVNKADKDYDICEAEVLDNGHILIELNQSMLSEAGICQVDVMLVDANGYIDYNTPAIVLTDSYILSTMSFYLNVQRSAARNDIVINSNSYNIFVNALTGLLLMEKNFEGNEATRIANENVRISNENTRISKEVTRTYDEEKRKTSEDQRIANEKARVNAEKERETTITTWGQTVDNIVERCNEVITNSSNAETLRQETFDGLELETLNLISDFEDFNNTAKESENKRVTAETQRQATFTASTNSCNQATTDCITATNNCNTVATSFNDAEALRVSNENTRISAENSRVNAENERIAAEIERRASSQTIINNCNTAIEETNSATERAIAAAEGCEGIINGSNLVLITDLYDENNLIKSSKLNTTFENKNREVIVSGEELSAILGKIAAYMNAFDNRQKILYNAENPSAEPDNSIGNNGDIYVKVIQE